MTTATTLSGGLVRLFPTAVLACAGVSSAVAGETITFFHNDMAGSPLLATDVNGIQIWKETYRPYGDRLIESAASENNDVWFTGKPYDESTGLSYMGARYYDPTLGRFTGVDPVGVDFENLHSFNRYAYANNNPLRFYDPNGEWAVSINLGLWGGSFGVDDRSGQFFWAQKVGMAGVGLAIDPSKNAPQGEGRLDRSCLSCMVESVSWEKANIEGGIVAGPLSWQPVNYDAGTLVSEHFGDADDHHYFIEGNGLEFDPLNFESVFTGGEGGLNVDLEANYEWGGTVSWKDFREALGLDPLENRNPNPREERRARRPPGD